MPSVSGEVQYVGQKNGNTNVKLDNDEWYGFYKVNSVNFSKGDVISFDFTQRGNFKNGDIKTVEVSNSANNNTNSDAPRPNNQDVIRYQSARNTAVAFLKLAHDADALPLPAKKGDKYDALQGLFYELTDKFFAEAAVQSALLPEELMDNVYSGNSSTSEWGEE